MRLKLVLCLLLIVWPALSSGTSVIEPTFERLVSEADAILETYVTRVASSLRTNATGKAIVTSVSFQVVRTLKGRPPANITLDFLGGTVGDLTHIVEDMPTFAVGEHDVLFVHTQARFISPLVGFMHGRFRVVQEPQSGTPTVRQFNGKALDSVERLGRRAAPLQASPISLTDFTARIADEVARQQAGSPR